MWDSIQLILLLAGYILVVYLIIKFIRNLITDLNPYLRLLLVSFIYALFWGVGIAFNGGDPGFAFPAPNIVAIALMLSDGFYRGLLTGLYILSFWWTIIFIVCLARQLIKNKTATPTKQHNDQSRELDS